LPAGEYRVMAVDAAGQHTATEITVSSTETQSVALTLGK
jgi:hypothetical protein